jgi:hypothetical protein
MIRTITCVGKVKAIFIATPSGPLPPPAGGFKLLNDAVNVEEVEAIATKGLKGDRWFGVQHYRLENGNLVPFPTSREVSLIAIEQINDLNSNGLNIEPYQLRRNILTEGIDLAKLVNRPFRVGNSIFVGAQLCQPCKHISEYLKEPKIIKALYNKGGLRCSIRRSGFIKIGDSICY